MKAILSGHSAYHTEYHVVWSTKYRKRVLGPGVAAYLRKLFPALLRDYPGVSLEEVGFDRDHVHMVLIIPPKYAVADVVGMLKSRSSSRLRKKFAFLEKQYWKEPVVWNPGYFVSSVGLDKATVKRYVKWQGQQDTNQEQRTLFL